ncbi:outer membrane lipoprotein carrier protein LolA [Comamonadaceae bacterium OH2310_COT-174]|nr:outer membrane lipoprotein carrier protein LolA [Comamonadaceae bacterium OH2310_COT-174]
MKKTAVSLALALLAPWAWADGLQALERFVQQVQSGQASFTQTVTAPPRDGEAGRVTRSSGTFAFARPAGQFRFDYLKPFPQQIVGDGKTLWIYDPDLEQVTARDQQRALSSTPAAIVSSASTRAALERDFKLESAPDADGLQWVLATPKASDGTLRSVRIGFAGDALAALEIEDNFGQRSALRFEGFEKNVALPTKRFEFKPPPGVDVVRDPAQ